MRTLSLDIHRQPPPDVGIDTRWLLRLRWLLYVGLLTLVAWIQLGLGVRLALAPLLALISAGGLSNAALALWLRGGGALGTLRLSGLMLADTGLITIILWLTGGPFNPFTALYLVNVVLATLVLPRLWAWAQLGASFLAFASLFWLERIDVLGGLQLPGHQELMTLHLQGMLVAFVLSAGAVVYFVGRVQAEVRERDRLLVAARQQSQRQEKLLALNTLAAGAAHELATPLGTIAVVARELEHGLSTRAADARFLEDAALIRSEVARCKGILDQLSVSAGELRGEALVSFPLEALLREACEGLAGAERVAVTSGAGTLTGPRTALVRAVRNLIKNALEASPGAVTVRARVEGSRTLVEVENGGPPLPEEVLERLGEPFFTTKGPGRGMGLGVFLSRSVAEQLGGGLSYRAGPGGGTVASLWIARREEPSQ